MGQVIEGIYSWVRNIVCFICFLNVFLQILPGEGFIKYVRFFGSLLLVVIVMEPLGNIIQITDDFEAVWEQESRIEAYDDLQISMQGMEELRVEKVNEAYETEIKRQIEEIVRGYDLEPLESALEFTEVDGTSQISSLSIQIKSQNPEDEDTKTKVENIKKEIVEVYQIKLDHINISIED